MQLEQIPLLHNGLRVLVKQLNSIGIFAVLIFHLGTYFGAIPIDIHLGLKQRNEVDFSLC